MASTAFILGAAFMFALEVYHVIGHMCIVLRVRLLPKRDLVRVRLYFLFDTLTVAVSAFLFTGKLQWLAALQIVQHMFFFITWHTHPYTEKVIIFIILYL